MITSNEAKYTFVKMLKESGFCFDRPDPKLAWKVLKEFNNIKVECADDALLFQCGVYDFTGEDLFHFEYVRQFIFETDDEYDHMEQLSLIFYFKPNSELTDLKTDLWTYACNTIDDFFSRVEEMEHFKTPLEKYVPFQCEIIQEEV